MHYLTRLVNPSSRRRMLSRIFRPSRRRCRKFQKVPRSGKIYLHRPHDVFYNITLGSNNNPLYIFCYTTLDLSLQTARGTRISHLNCWLFLPWLTGHTPAVVSTLLRSGVAFFNPSTGVWPLSTSNWTLGFRRQWFCLCVCVAATGPGRWVGGSGGYDSLRRISVYMDVLMPAGLGRTGPPMDRPRAERPPTGLVFIQLTRAAGFLRPVIELCQRTNGLISETAARLVSLVTLRDTVCGRRETWARWHTLQYIPSSYNTIVVACMDVFPSFKNPAGAPRDEKLFWRVTDPQQTDHSGFQELTVSRTRP